MGSLVDGEWREGDSRTAADGRFVRKEAQFRNWITADGTPGASGVGGFPAAADRYHLYVSHACPWAHRTLIYRKLKGLDGMISLSVVNPFMGSTGWSFEPGPGVVVDPIGSAQHMHQVYTRADPRYSGRASVPVLWDKLEQTIVSNESSEIIRMLNNAFDHLGAEQVDYYPQPLRDEIDELNAEIYANVNNGVYRAGFARKQETYESAVRDVFATLDALEERLAGRRYLTGSLPTEADWRLFPTLVRFDPVYASHFKCNWRRISDYPNLWGYVCDLYQLHGIAETVNLDHIKQHYYRSHESINPTRIVPTGPDIDYAGSHDRARLQ